MTGGIDGQFVIVTLAALAGAWVLLRPLLPARLGGPRASAPTGACGRCSSADCGKETAPPSPGLVRIGEGRAGSAVPPGAAPPPA